ncbi:hypothetical protein IKQ26_04225 [bacterium]|nr:hypothetical protein [bacterium]
MRISPINYYAQRNIYCQPLKKNTPSFGMKMSKEGLEYMSALGADIKEPIDESYINEPNIMINMLRDIVNANGRKTEARMRRFAQIVDYYGSSVTLPESLKTKFIHDQIMGDYGQKLNSFFEVSKGLNENDRKVLERSLVDLYIKGVSHNREIDIRDTMIFFNKVKDYMTFKESTYSNAALKTSIESMDF